MGCPVSVALPLTTVWTKKDDTNFVAFIASGWMSTAGIEYMRPFLDMIPKSGSLRVSIGYQVTDDPGVPGSSYQIEELEVTAEGPDTASGYSDEATNVDGKAHIRFVYLVRNIASGSTLEMCQIRGRVDFKP